jgi:hypothetical protein
MLQRASYYIKNSNKLPRAIVRVVNEYYRFFIKDREDKEFIDSNLNADE